MFNPAEFTAPTAKPLPVVLLLDVSSSMDGEKINALNKATQEMLTAFVKAERMETEILLAVITFGNEVKLHIPYKKASQVEWQNLEANGWTPMGTALKMVKAMIEDKATTPSRAYRPTIVLVSDGEPNDEWEQPLNDFIREGRSAKCDRMAMGIGQISQQAETVLKRFIMGTNNPLFHAKDATQIAEFFKKVTMSVTTRVNSKDPNVIPASIVYENSTVSQSVNGTKPSNQQPEEDEGYF